MVAAAESEDKRPASDNHLCWLLVPSAENLERVLPAWVSLISNDFPLATPFCSSQPRVLQRFFPSDGMSPKENMDR